MPQTSPIKNLLDSTVQHVESTFQQAGEHFSSLEESTRRFIETAAERVRESSADGVRLVEETLKAQEKLTRRVDEIVNSSDFAERVQRLVSSAASRLQLNNQEELAELRAEIEALRERVNTLRKNMDSANRKLASRPLKREFNALITRVDKLEGGKAKKA